MTDQFGPSTYVPVRGAVGLPVSLSRDQTHPAGSVGPEHPAIAGP